MKLTESIWTRSLILPLLTSFLIAAPDSAISQTSSRDHRIELNDAISAVVAFKEWMIAPGRSGQIDGALNPLTPARSHYSLKGLEIRKFLQKEDQDGVDLGWTNDAKETTAVKSENWVFFPMTKGVEDISSGKSIRSRPLAYGERFALVWQPFTGEGARAAKMFEVIFKKRGTGDKVAGVLDGDLYRGTGINLMLAHRGSPRELKYDWAIVGGRPGAAIKLGSDRIVLYNVTFKQPLIFYPRKRGGRIGWPVTKSDQAGQKLGNNKKELIAIEIWEKLLLQ